MTLKARTHWTAVPLADFRQPTQSMVKYQTFLIQTVGQLSAEFADNYGEMADYYIPTGALALEPADSELESANSSADSNADPPKIGM